MTLSTPPDPAAIHRMLLSTGLTVAVAESLTGGLLSAALTQSAGASAIFRGGLVVYSTDLKAVLAGVPQPLLQAQGPVSADVAAALALGARNRLGADLGLGITGVAGPDPVGADPAGTVYVAVSGAGFGEVTRAQLTGSRTEIREASVDLALSVLAAALRTGQADGMPEGLSSVTP